MTFSHLLNQFSDFVDYSEIDLLFPRRLSGCRLVTQWCEMIPRFGDLYGYVYCTGRDCPHLDSDSVSASNANL